MIREISGLIPQLFFNNKKMEEKEVYINISLEAIKGSDEIEQELHVEGEGGELVEILASFFIEHGELMPLFTTALKEAVLHKISNGIKNLGTGKKIDFNAGSF